MKEPNFVVEPTASTHFANRGNGAEEMKWGAAAEYGETVPNDRFYVHNRSRAPEIDVDAFRLEIRGSGVTRPRAFTYEEILALPPVTCRRTLDCAANCRAFFPKVAPRESVVWPPIGFTQWHFGAVGAAEWTGARMKDLLALAGLGRAVDVRLTALDSIAVPGGKLPFSQVIALDKVLANDTLLAYRMNGETLPVDHGFPVRAIFSGWGGNTAVKWLGSVEVSADPLPLSYFQEQERLIGPEYPEPEILTVGRVRSAIELDADVTLSPGDHTLRGRAWSGAGAIERVDVCVERLVAPSTWIAVWDPAWREAVFLHDPEPFTWVRFEISWEGVEPGYYRLMSRATDEDGNTQPRPEDVPWNEHGVGYHGHAPLGVAVRHLDEP